MEQFFMCPCLQSIGFGFVIVILDDEISKMGIADISNSLKRKKYLQIKATQYFFSPPLQ